MSEELIVSKAGAIARVVLNRPEAFNAFNGKLRAALSAAIAEIDDDEAVRIVILSGAGRGFCAGADLTEPLTEPVHMMIDRDYRPIFTGIAASPKIWIAQVHGSAAGIGGALAMACDLMTMDEGANVYMAFAAIGLVPDGGACWQLLRAMGYRHALQAILEGRKIAAADALAYGITNLVAPAGELEGRTTALAEKLAAGAPLATAAAKRLLRQMDRLSFEEAVSREGVEQARLIRSADAAEGIAAFLAKRKPVFEGK